MVFFRAKRLKKAPTML